MYLMQSPEHHHAKHIFTHFYIITKIQRNNILPAYVSYILNYVHAYIHRENESTVYRRTSSVTFPQQTQQSTQKKRGKLKNGKATHIFQTRR